MEAPEDNQQQTKPPWGKGAENLLLALTAFILFSPLMFAIAFTVLVA